MPEDFTDQVVAPGVVVNPARRNGRPTIQGTRVAVEDILYALAAGESPDHVAYGYRITPDQVMQALVYVANLVHDLVPEISDEDLDRLAREGGRATPQNKVG